MEGERKTVIELSEKDLDQAIRDHARLIVDCSAPWCPDCRALDPVYTMLAAEYSGRVAFAKIQINQNHGVKEAYQVMAVPTLLMFRDGRLVHRLVEPAPKKAALQNEIDSNLT